MKRTAACLFSLSGCRKVNERCLMTCYACDVKNSLKAQLETQETVERFLFPVEHDSDGRLKHKYARPPDTTDTRARFNMLLCSEVTRM